MRSEPIEIRLAALQLVLLSLPRVSLVSGVNPSLTGPEALPPAQFLVLSHIVALLSSG
jgi:hypothetical protein